MLRRHRQTRQQAQCSPLFSRAPQLISTNSLPSRYWLTTAPDNALCRKLRVPPCSLPAHEPCPGRAPDGPPCWVLPSRDGHSPPSDSGESARPLPWPAFSRLQCAHQIPGIEWDNRPEDRFRVSPPCFSRSGSRCSTDQSAMNAVSRFERPWRESRIGRNWPVATKLIKRQVKAR